MLMTTLGPYTQAELETKKQAIVAQYGPWTISNIHLGHGVWTIAADPCTDDDPRLRRFMQIILDVTQKPLSQLRILDLGCLEGIYCLEFALHGAQVVGVEGRESNYAKCRLLADVFQLDNLQFRHDLVQNLNPETYGLFDVVLCSGLLYHLGAPDVFAVVEKIASVCQRVFILHTHLRYKGKDEYTYQGHTYLGRSIPAYDPNYPCAWHAIDTDFEFWLTRPSIYNLLHHVGFTSVYECFNPVGSYLNEDFKKYNRDCPTFVAIAGQKPVFKLRTALNHIENPDWEQTVDGIPTPLFMTGGDVVADIFNPNTKLHC